MADVLIVLRPRQPRQGHSLTRCPRLPYIASRSAPPGPSRRPVLAEVVLIFVRIAANEKCASLHCLRSLDQQIDLFAVNVGVSSRSGTLLFTHSKSPGYWRVLVVHPTGHRTPIDQRGLLSLLARHGIPLVLQFEQAQQCDLHGAHVTRKLVCLLFQALDNVEHSLLALLDRR